MINDKETIELLKSVKAGSDEAFSELSRKYSAVIDASVYSFGKSTVGVSEEDLKQEACLGMYRAAESYDMEKYGDSVTFGLYCKVCIRNALISDRRRKLRAERKAEKLKEEAGHFFKAGVPFVTAECAEFEELLRKSDEVLSPYERNVFREFAEGKPVREISSVLGRSEKSVSNAIYRIKKKLRGPKG